MLEKCQKIEDMMVDPDLNVSGIDFRFSGELRDVKRGKMFRKVGCLKPARTEKDAIGIRKNVLNTDNNTNGEEKEEDAIRFVEREEIEVDLLRLRNKGEEEETKMKMRTRKTTSTTRVDFSSKMASSWTRKGIWKL